MNRAELEQKLGQLAYQISNNLKAIKKLDEENQILQKQFNEVSKELEKLEQ